MTTIRFVERAAPPDFVPDYYLSATGNNANDGLTADTPWQTFGKAWSVLAAGDSLGVMDGTYTSASPPAEKSGTAGNPIVVRAINPGAAVLDTLQLEGCAYLTFIGFRIDATANAVTLVSNGTGKPSHHNIFQQIGFSTTLNVLNDNAGFSLSDGAHHNLLEDSWGWGGARYTVMCYGGPGGNPPNTTCDYNTFRRVVLRQGPGTSSNGNPQAALAIYYASNNIIENVISLDSVPSSNSSNADFYLTGHAPPPNADYNKFYGVISLDTLGNGVYIDVPGAVGDYNEIVNSVIWNAAANGIVVAGGTGVGDSCDFSVVDHNTVGYSGDDGYLNYAGDNTTMTNNAFLHNGAYGANQSGSAGSTTPNDHNGYHSNTSGARLNLSAGTGDLTSDPGLLYLLRIEDGSAYKSAGGSGDIGATVVNRYVDGTLTGTALWPWPYEARLKTEMSEDYATGFCGSAKTLTTYIWEYLGNTIPGGIY